MSTKLYDVAVKTGEYVKNGETKGRYENIGTVMQGEDGQFLILKRTFNPAGVPNPDNRDSLIASFFAPQEQQGGQQNNQNQNNQQNYNNQPNPQNYQNNNRYQR